MELSSCALYSDLLLSKKKKKNLLHGNMITEQSYHTDRKDATYRLLDSPDNVSGKLNYAICYVMLSNKLKIRQDK